MGCGHCKCKDKDLKPSLRDCKFFKQELEEDTRKEKEEHCLKVLKEVETTIKYLKLYLNKNEESQKVDTCLKDRIK